MIKYVWLLFIGLGITACGPSPIQFTSTAIAAQQQMATATPTYTLTFTPTLTPTSTPTPTPTSTPTIPPTPVPTLWGGYRENQLVAYKSNKSQACTYFGDIIVSRLDGTNITNLTKDLPGYKIFGKWSPNGEWIVFGRYDIGDGITTSGLDALKLDPIEVWIMRFDGAQKKFLSFTTGPNEISNISWSPDSKNFLAACLVGEAQYGICLGNTEDFTIEHLSFNGIHPTFSPNGKSYAWLGWNHSGDMSQASLYVLPGSGSTAVSLATPSVESTPSRFTEFGIEDFLWSVDSHHILFDAVGSIYDVDIDNTTKLKLVVDLKKDVYLDSLSPDGSYLLVRTDMPYLVDLKNNSALPLQWATYNTAFLWSPSNLLLALKSGYVLAVDLTTGRPEKVDNSDWGTDWTSIKWNSCRAIQP